MSLTTYCPDTPAAWSEFNRLKNQRSTPRARRDKAIKLNERLNQQISKENAYLRSLRQFLPGHEPDRNVL